MKFKKLKNLIKATSAKLSTESINAAILALILIVVIFKVYSTLVPEAQSAGDEMNVSNRCAAVGCNWNESAAVDCNINTSPEGNATSCATPYVVPLSSLFSGQGIVFIIIMAALVVVIIRSIMPKGKK